MTAITFGTFRLLYQPTPQDAAAMAATSNAYDGSRHTYYQWAALVRTAWLESRLS